jgi:carboxyl-terminal processing protease
MTIAQFFRINGGTTQLRGVTPDIPLPTDSETEPFGESSFDNPLPWTQIKPVDYAPAADARAIVPLLLPLHEARVKQDKEFQFLMEDLAEAKLQRKKNQVSLNERTRRAEVDAQEAKQKARESQKDAGRDAAKGARADAAAKDRTAGKDSAFKDDGLQADERNLANLLAAEKARKEAKDIVLNEAVNILSDAAGIAKADPRLAARIQPRPSLMPQ